jgi:hypothetical protein
LLARHISTILVIFFSATGDVAAPKGTRDSPLCTEVCAQQRPGRWRAPDPDAKIRRDVADRRTRHDEGRAA